jgi:molybdopterin synthase sulfur carrier subunit
MLKIVYFASLRERLGKSQDEIMSPEINTVAGVIDALVALNGDLWQQVLLESQVLTAVNQEMCDQDQQVVDGDEVAFFPPVTGG